MRSTILICLLAALLCACGSSEDGPIAPPPSALELFDGDYHHLSVWGSTDRGIGSTTWGSAEGDGAGTCSWQHLRNTDRIIYPAVGTEGQTGWVYTVRSDRTVGWTTDPTSLALDWFMLEGGVSVDGAVLGLGSQRYDPRAEILIRTSSGLDTSVLTGDYTLVGFGFVDYGTTPGDHGHQSSWGTATFDGTSSADLSGGANRDGTVSAFTSTLDYAVGPDGTVDAGLGGAAAFSGAVSEDGHLAVIAGGTNDGENPHFLVFVMQPTGATSALFSGSYFAVGLEYDDSTQQPVMRSYEGTVSPDGSGSVTATFTRNEEKTITGVSPLWTGYTVDPDGTMTVTTASMGTLEGGVSADGRFALLAGGSGAGENPIFFFLYK